MPQRFEEEEFKLLRNDEGENEDTSIQVKAMKTVNLSFRLIRRYQ